MGDFQGLGERIDYVADLGVTCLWLMPFFPTTDRDDGYDITDYYGVDPRLGTLGDFVEVVRTARDRGMRVIIDLVLNHTSDKHPWFRAARRSPTSPYRDFYVWRTEEPPDTSAQVVFPDKEDSLWQYDDAAGAWYFHRFYRTQPDLNFTDSRVRDEMLKIMGFWIELGISGFRVDAVPFLIDPEGVDAETRRQFGDPHDHLRDLRSFLERRVGDAALLGEVNLPYPDQRKFFGGDDADELTMQFDFIAMQNLYLSLAREDARPAGPRADATPEDGPRLPVGDVRAQPRRADARQAERQGARRGLRGVRPGPGHAALRPRAPAPAASDARRRPATAAARLQPAVLPPRHAGALLRRGDRHGREPRHPRPARGPDAHAVERRAQRWLLRRRAVASTPPRDRGWVRAGPRQRGGPAHRPGLVAELHAAAHPALPRVARSSAGPTSSPSTSRTATSWPTSARRTTGGWWQCTTWPTRAARCRSPWTTVPRGPCSPTCSRTDGRPRWGPVVASS